MAICDPAYMGDLLAACDKTTRSTLDIAREHLASAQKLNEIESMQPQAFFILGCALNKVIEYLDGQTRD